MKAGRGASTRPTRPGRTWIATPERPVWPARQEGRTAMGDNILGRIGNLVRANVNALIDDAGLGRTGVILREAQVADRLCDGLLGLGDVVPVSYTHLTLPTILRV